MISMLLSLVAASSAPALAQSDLKPLSHLVGRCFTGDAPDNGGKDTHCFELVYGGQHIRDRHVVSVAGKAVYAGEALYSLEKRKITFTYWNSLGGVGRGTAVARPGGISFSGSIHATPDGKEQPIATVWRNAASGYDVFDDGSAKARPFRPAG